MTSIKSTRIQSIDILRGLVMVIMALDHVRDFFHSGAFVADPTNMDTTTPILFFTRFLTHYCAPVFIFLAGTSAFLYGQRKTKKELSKFLITRGLWIIFVEVVIINLFWWFDIHYSIINLQVLWAIGLCMVLLGALIHLPKKALLILGLVLIFGHNLLDGITAEGNSIMSILWYVLHQSTFMPFGENGMMFFMYPILPWVGVITLGYCFGSLYVKDFDPTLRKKYLLKLGLGAIILFLIIRGINIYGDMAPWSSQKNGVYTFMSFFNVTKYPPSLLFLLITLGPAMLFLRGIETVKTKLTDFFLVFGRVPFFYYVLHILVIHIVAMVGLELTGDSWQRMILTKDVLWQGQMAGYGYSLGVTYLVWIGIVALLYPICLRYMKYKLANKDKWWLSYL